MTLKSLVPNTQSPAKTTAKLYRLSSSETTTYNSIREEHQQILGTKMDGTSGTN